MKRRYILAGLLALACFCASVLPCYHGIIISRAASFRGTNIWGGGSETVLGHRRNYLYRWSDGYQTTFCIAPGKHMGSDVTFEIRNTAIDDADIP